MIFGAPRRAQLVPRLPSNLPSPPQQSLRGPNGAAAIRVSSLVAGMARSSSPGRMARSSASGHVRRFSQLLLSEMQTLRWFAFRLRKTRAAMFADSGIRRASKELSPGRPGGRCRATSFSNRTRCAGLRFGSSSLVSRLSSPVNPRRGISRGQRPRPFSPEWFASLLKQQCSRIPAFAGRARNPRPADPATDAGPRPIQIEAFASI